MGSMDGDETVDAFDVAINEDMAELARLNNELVGLESYRELIKTQGMSKNIGFGLEHIAPGTLGNLNLNMLTEIPTATKMNVALESIDWKSRITKVAIVILVVTVILKMLDWLLTPSSNRVTGSSRDGDAAAKAIHDAKEKIRKEIKEAGADINARPTQNVVREVADKDEAWMRPVYRVLEEMLDKRRINDKEALRAISVMKMYRSIDLTGAGDREINLPILFIFLLKSGLVMQLSNLGFYLKIELGHEISDQIPGPFAREIFGYSKLRNRLANSLLTISRILKQGTDAGIEVERAYKANGDITKFYDYVGEIAQEVTMYNGELKTAFENIFGNGQDEDVFIFDGSNAGRRWVPPDVLLNRYDKLAADYNSYRTQPAGSKYDHQYFINGLVARNTFEYKIRGCAGEHIWWGDGYNTMASLGSIDLLNRNGDKDLKMPMDLDLDISNWMLRTICSEVELSVAITDSNKRMLALRDELMGSGNTETMRLKDLCDDLLSELKVIEKRAREKVPTVWHVPWRSNTGLHFTDIDESTGKDRAIIDSTFGEVCSHLLNGTKAHLNAFISTKTVYQKIEKSYLAFREAIEKFRV